MVQFRSVRFASGGDEESRPEPLSLDEPLTAIEVRVLGCLVEKEVLTPDVYPLTLNSLVTACNQKTSREPVVSLDDATVDATLEVLKSKGLVTRITGAEHRVPKYRQLFTQAFNLNPRESAVMCVLMLRGPQTPGEINQRTGRLYEFASLGEAEETLDQLMRRAPAPLVTRVERHPGYKEPRYGHLLSGLVEGFAEPAPPAAMHAPPAAPREDRLARVESEMAALRAEVEELRRQFGEFRKQFE